MSVKLGEQEVSVGAQRDRRGSEGRCARHDIVEASSNRHHCVVGLRMFVVEPFVGQSVCLAIQHQLDDQQRERPDAHAQQHQRDTLGDRAIVVDTESARARRQSAPRYRASCLPACVRASKKERNDSLAALSSASSRSPTTSHEREREREREREARSKSDPEQQRRRVRCEATHALTLTFTHHLVEPSQATWSSPRLQRMPSPQRELVTRPWRRRRTTTTATQRASGTRRREREGDKRRGTRETRGAEASSSSSLVRLLLCCCWWAAPKSRKCENVASKPNTDSNQNPMYFACYTNCRVTCVKLATARCGKAPTCPRASLRPPAPRPRPVVGAPRPTRRETERSRDATAKESCK